LKHISGRRSLQTGAPSSNDLRINDDAGFAVTAAVQPLSLNEK